MAEDYGRPEWLEDEAAATAEAERRIRALADTGGDTLDFADLSALTALPEALGDAPSLRRGSVLNSVYGVGPMRVSAMLTH